VALVTLLCASAEISLRHSRRQFIFSLRKKFMKKLLHIAALGFCLVTAQVQAQDEKVTQANKTPAKTMEEKKTKGTQQDKMKRCNAEAKGMKGDERKTKMSACLKG
jgi:hypothetical protein